MTKPKIVRIALRVEAKRQIKTPEITMEFYNKIPIWSFKNSDFSHERWGFCKSCNINDIEQVLFRLKNFEGQVWGEILTDKSGRDHNTKNHPIPISEIDEEAQERLKYLNFKFVDELYSLTITGEDRLWGVIDYETSVFQILWVDNKHQIYKTAKSHS